MLWLTAIVVATVGQPAPVQCTEALSLARSKIALVLNVRPQEVRFANWGQPPVGSGWAATCTVRGRAYSVKARPADGTFRLESAAGWKAESSDVGLSKAQATAVAIVTRLFKNRPGLKLAHATPVSPNWYSFLWEERLATDVLTGTSVSVFVAKRGTLDSYSEHVVQRHTKPGDVKISRERGERIGEGIVRGLISTGERPRLRSQRLILSNLLSPTRGPVWQLTYDVSKPDGEPVRGHFIVIDAITGYRLPLH